MMRVSDRDLERYIAGALEGERADAIASACAEDPSLRERLERLEASNMEILARYPPREVARRVQERTRTVPSWPRTGAMWLPALLATAALVWVASRPAGPSDPRALAPSERIKGLSPQIQLYREGQRGALDQGEEVSPGDVLQITFVRGENAHGTIFAVDGRGAVTVHARVLPESQPSGEVALEAALVLDNAPLFERFFLVTCPEPLDVDALLERARLFGEDTSRARDAQLPTPPGCEQSSRLLLKEASP